MAQVKLIAEPWDLRRGRLPGRQLPARLGRMEWQVSRYAPALFGEATDGTDSRTRPTAFPEAATFTGAGAGTSTAAFNFFACHDGFTLNDLVSYEQKHNQANGEDNRDGHDDNLSCNWGAEGPTDNPQIIEAARGESNAILWQRSRFSQGVPMIGAGDELGRTQKGNNNAYCQDNEISWLDWELDEHKRALLKFNQPRPSRSADRTRCCADEGSSGARRWPTARNSPRT